MERVRVLKFKAAARSVDRVHIHVHTFIYKGYLCSRLTFGSQVDCEGL